MHGFLTPDKETIVASKCYTLTRLQSRASPEFVAIAIHQRIQAQSKSETVVNEKSAKSRTVSPLPAPLL
jgi:hypothetical protein